MATGGAPAALDTKPVKSRLDKALLWLDNVHSASEKSDAGAVRSSLQGVVVQTRRAYAASLLLLADDQAASSDWPGVLETARAAVAADAVCARAHYYVGRAHMAAAAHADAAAAFRAAAARAEGAEAADYARWAARAAEKGSKAAAAAAAAAATAAAAGGGVEALPVADATAVKAVGGGEEGSAAAAAVEKGMVADGTPAMPPPPPTGPRMEWYQSPRTVTVDVYAKGADKEASTVHITERRLEVCVKIPGAPDYELERDLFAAVEPGASSWKATKYKVEITLVKASAGDWKALGSGPGTTELSATEKARVLGEQKVKAAKTAQKNWDSIADKELEGEKEDDGPMALFRTIFKDADEDTQRAMMKSYQESGGKVLSTDWKDVGSRKVEYVEKD